MSLHQLFHNPKKCLHVPIWEPLILGATHFPEVICPNMTLICPEGLGDHLVKILAYSNNPEYDKKQSVIFSTKYLLMIFSVKTCLEHLPRSFQHSTNFFITGNRQYIIYRGFLDIPLHSKFSWKDCTAASSSTVNTVCLLVKKIYWGFNGRNSKW